MDINEKFLKDSKGMVIDNVEDSDLMQFSAVITTDSCDREGEVLLPSGAALKNYMANPVLLFNHDLEKPIGKVLEILPSQDKIFAKFQLARGDELAEKMWNLIKTGTIKGISVGFLKKELRKPTAKDKEMFGPDVKSVISKFEIIEVSLVSVGCNQDALIYDYKSVDIVKEESQEVTLQEVSKEELKIEEKSLEIVAEKGFSGKRENAIKEVDYKEVVEELKALYILEMKKMKGILY